MTEPWTKSGHWQKCLNRGKNVWTLLKMTEPWTKSGHWQKCSDRGKNVWTLAKIDEENIFLFESPKINT